MDKLTITRSFVPKAKGQQPWGTAQPAQPAWQADKPEASNDALDVNPPSYGPFDAPDDDAGIKSSDEDEGAQPQNDSLPGAGPIDVMPAPDALSYDPMTGLTKSLESTQLKSRGGGKSRQIVAPILTGAQVQAESSWCFEAAKGKRKRTESTSDAQDERVCKQQRQTKVVKAAGSEDPAATKKSDFTGSPPELGLNQRIERASKTNVTRREEDNPFPTQQLKLPTHYQDLGMISMTAAPIVSSEGTIDSSIISLNQAWSQDTPQLPPLPLTEDETAGIEQARTHEGLRVFVVTKHHYAVLQEVQDQKAPQPKDLFTLTSSEKRFMQKAKKREGAQRMNVHQLTKDEWAMVQKRREREGQKRQMRELQAKFHNAHFDETCGIPTNPSQVARGQGTGIPKADAEEEDDSSLEGSCDGTKCQVPAVDQPQMLAVKLLGTGVEEDLEI